MILQKKVNCHFCNSKNTIGSCKEDSIWFCFHCDYCKATIYLLAKDANKEMLKKASNILKKYKILPEITPKMKTPVEQCCPICFQEVKDVKLTKTNKYWYWKCKNCQSKGYVSRESLPRWNLLSSLIICERGKI